MDPKKRGREAYIHNRPIDFSSVPLTLISPIFGRLSDNVFTPKENLRSEDFAPARNLANMLLSRLENKESTRSEAFRKWLLETLGIREMKLSDDRHELLEQHTEGPPRLAAVITWERKTNLESEGHVEWRDYVLIITEGRAEGSSEPHWRSMAYFRAYYMQKRCSYRVGESCLPAILIVYHGMISYLLAGARRTDAFQGHTSTYLGLSCVPTDRYKCKH
jgi:hypothetical protein